MSFSKFNQKDFRDKLKLLQNKIKEDILSIDKEIAEMKITEKKDSANDESRITNLVDSISFAEESLYEIIISRVELEAILALVENGFDLIEFDALKKRESVTLILKKDGVNINLEISTSTKLLLEELTLE